MKSLIFSPEMARAITENGKTQTRRLLKPAKPIIAKQQGHKGQGDYGLWVNDYDGSGETAKSVKDYSVSCCWIDADRYIAKYAPFGIGDIFYVKEKWREQPMTFDQTTCEYSDFEFQYKAEFTDEEDACYGRRGGLAPWKWRNPMYMPKEAARHYLKITAPPRLEKFNRISEADALAEGFKSPAEFLEYVAELYRDFSPEHWCWVYEFERIEKP